MKATSTKQTSRKPAVRSTDLYRDERISVTPSWLSVDNFRYPIRTVVSMESSTIRPRLGTAYMFFFGAIILMAYSLYQFTKPALPEIVPWVMLIASVAIFLYAATVAFRSRTRYQIIVTLIDGARVPVVTNSGKQAQGILDSLTSAMDWHLQSDVLFDAKRSSHIRKAHATSTKKDQSKTKPTSASNAEPAPAQADSARANDDPLKPHPSRVVRKKLAPMILAMLKGRD